MLSTNFQYLITGGQHLEERLGAHRHSGDIPIREESYQWSLAFWLKGKHINICCTKKMGFYGHQFRIVIIGAIAICMNCGLSHGLNAFPLFYRLIQVVFLEEADVSTISSEGSCKFCWSSGIGEGVCPSSYWIHEMLSSRLQISLGWWNHMKSQSSEV